MNPKRLVLWIIWFGITSGLCTLYFVVGRGTDIISSESNAALRFIPMAPLALSVLVRFFLLPRIKSLSKVLPFYIIGLSMAEGSGIIAIFLLPHGDATSYFTTALFVLVMYVPLFANKLEES
jgi:hypothetical protein